MGSVIITHLIDGDPQGIRSVFIKNKTCQMYVIPRLKIAEAQANPDINLHQPAVYVLLEHVNVFDADKPKAYVGHAEDFYTRIDQHLKNSEKNFFQTALVFVATDSSINKADVQYLEAKSIQAARAAERYDMSPNKNGGTVPHLSPDQRDVIEEFKEFVWLLTFFYGCNIFRKPSEKAKGTKEETIKFYLNKPQTEAVAEFSNDEMVLKAGSVLRRSAVPSIHNKPQRDAKVLEACEEQDGKLVLKKDLPFSSPSTAATFACGVSTNGWAHWKTKDNKTLDELFRVKENL